MKKDVFIKGIKFFLRPIFHYFTNKRQRQVTQYARYFKKLPVKSKTILYESRDGNSITDSPNAIFEYMLKKPEFKEYVHIWSVQDPHSLSGVMNVYKDTPNVKFVQRNSKRYLKYLASCEYLINNSTFQSFFTPKEDQVYINTWHGTPLKSMGYDIPGNPSNSQNVVRNFLSADYLISPNAHTTKMFTDSYKLDGLYEGTIIEEGYPRMDLTLNSNPKEIRESLRNLGVNIDESKQCILYAPTWKGTDVTKADNDVLQMMADMNELEENFGDRYNFLVKVHPYLYKEALKQPEIHSRLIPDYIDTNKLLATIDVLITDYSSIFFDFLVTNKPILFYTWDLDVYTEQRGQYLGNDDLPGPLLFNIKEVAKAIDQLEQIEKAYKEKYVRMQREFTHYDDGKVTERIVNYIFKNAGEKLNLHHSLSASKEKILIYPGGMRNNGITSSFINLMNNMDFQRFDVTCFMNTPHSQEILNNIGKINTNVRMLFKPGYPIYDLYENYKDKYIHTRGKKGFWGEKLYPQEAYKREHKRLFGKTHFDYVIDFSGYSFYWAKYLLAAADAKRKICYMHNDLLSDSKKVINGKKPHSINLRGLFLVYNQFDKLVSVSKGTMELNRANLYEYADPDKFDYVLNSINPEKILGPNNESMQGSKETSIITEMKSRALLSNVEGYQIWNNLPWNQGAKTVDGINLYKGAEVFVSRKAKFKDHLYYKISHNYKIAGWIEAKEVELLPDTILSEATVNKIAKITKTGGVAIWTKPYKLPGVSCVSESVPYKDIVGMIFKEATTQKGSYSQFTIMGTPIGWIETSALTIYESCTFEENLSGIDRIKIQLKRSLLQKWNAKKHKSVYQQFENRTLRTVHLKHPKTAVISKAKNEYIWSRPYPNWGATRIEKAEKYLGKTVQINAIAKTHVGYSYLIYEDFNEIGWITYNALEKVARKQQITKLQETQHAELKLGNKYAIWNKPLGYRGAKLIENFSSFEGKVVELNAEAQTANGKYSHILLNGETVGWVDHKALLIKELATETDSEQFNFVNMGRLSPEKGQDRLISAFASFHKKHPNSKLYILGEGPLKSNLQNLIQELNMEGSISLMGQVENPFTVMKKCDCFVLSSHYEGQPMVLLEAMTLGMKIIATDIVANRTVLEDGKYGLLVENSEEGIQKGLEEMAEKSNDLCFEVFDYSKYNASAMQSFYNVLKI